MTTPQRALELAEWAEDVASYIDTEDEIGQPFHEAEEEKRSYLQLAKIARHYAEIMQAEVVRYLVRDKTGAGGGGDHSYRTSLGITNDQDLEEFELIIKPKPLP